MPRVELKSGILGNDTFLDSWEDGTRVARFQCHIIPVSEPLWGSPVVSCRVYVGPPSVCPASFLLSCCSDLRDAVSSSFVSLWGSLICQPIVYTPGLHVCLHAMRLSFIMFSIIDILPCLYNSLVTISFSRLINKGKEMGDSPLFFSYLDTCSCPGGRPVGGPSFMAPVSSGQSKTETWF